MAPPASPAPGCPGSLAPGSGSPRFHSHWSYCACAHLPGAGLHGAQAPLAPGQGDRGLGGTRHIHSCWLCSEAGREKCHQALRPSWAVLPGICFHISPQMPGAVRVNNRYSLFLATGLLAPLSYQPGIRKADESCGHSPQSSNCWWLSWEATRG